MIQLLLHCDGSEGSILFPDSSGLNHVVNSIGGAIVDADIKKFGTGSVQLDGVNACLQVVNPALLIQTQYFTIDFWVNFNYLPDDGTIGLWQWYENDNNYCSFYLSISAGTSLLKFDVKSGGSWLLKMSVPVTLFTSYWHHMVVQRGWGPPGLPDFQSWVIFKDGYEEITGVYAGDFPLYVGDFHVGRATDDLIVPAQHYLSGRIDEFHVSVGYPEWDDAPFTPPTLPWAGPTPSASISPSISPSASLSPSRSPSISPSVSPSLSASPSPSPSPSLSPTVSASVSSSISPSISPTPSMSPSASLSPSVSASISPSASASPSVSPSPSPSPAPVPYPVTGLHRKVPKRDITKYYATILCTTFVMTSPYTALCDGISYRIASASYDAATGTWQVRILKDLTKQKNSFVDNGALH